MITNEEIKEYIDGQLETNGKFVGMEVRRVFGIGGSRLERILKEYLNDNIIESTPIGYVLVNDLEEPNDHIGETCEDMEEVEELEDEDNDLIGQKLYKVQKQLQRSRDENTVLRRLIREDSRTESKNESVKGFLKEHIKLLDAQPKINVIESTTDDCEKLAIIQISDTHFGELVLEVDTKGTNSYNWETASARLHKYATECKKQLHNEGVSEVIIALTGDLINSDRRKSEILRAEDSRSVTTVAAVDLLSHFILDIRESVDKITVVSVFGNESRLSQDIESVGFEDNFDYLIHEFLDIRFQNFEDISFMPPKFDHSMVVRNILGNCNVLFIHGHARTDLKKENLKFTSDSVDPLIIHYLICGHLHSSLIDDKSRRSSSLVGSNGYSYGKLGLHSSPEQTMHILFKEHPDRIPIMRSIVINLEYINNIGYPLIRDDLYEAKDYKRHYRSNVVNYKAK